MFVYFSIISALLLHPSTTTSEPPAGLRILDNGRVRIGIDLGKGGAITFLSHVGGPNIVNDFDLGRQIQMSYYSGPVPFAPAGKSPLPAWAGLGWNPIQTGDCFGHPSRTLDFHATDDEMYVKAIPMQWPLNDVPGDCTFESWIRLDGDVVHVRSRITNSRLDKTQYPARTQELPAVYTNGPWYRLITYGGSRPFENDAISEFKPQFPWVSFFATEDWVALVNAKGDGVGVFQAGNQTFSGGFAGRPGSGGEQDFPTGYIAPNRDEILDANIRYDDEYTLILGDLTKIRAWVYAHRPRPSAPLYRFRRDRQHWTYINAEDTGWPIRGGLKVRLEKNDPQLIGPTTFWSAADAPRIRIRAAFRTTGNRTEQAQLFWSPVGAPSRSLALRGPETLMRGNEMGFSESLSLRFPIVGDGKERVYDIDLSKSPLYSGTMARLRFDPEPAGHPGDEIVVGSIELLPSRTPPRRRLE